MTIYGGHEQEIGRRRTGGADPGSEGGGGVGARVLGRGGRGECEGQGRGGAAMRGAERGVAVQGHHPRTPPPMLLGRRRAVESWAGLIGLHGPDCASRPPH